MSSGSIRTCGCSRFAIRASADSGSPCEPVETSTTFSGGSAAASSRVDHQPGRHVQQPEVAGHAHVAHHRAADERDLPAVRGGRVEHLLHPVHVRGEAGHDDPPGRLPDDRVEHRADARAPA